MDLLHGPRNFAQPAQAKNKNGTKASRIAIMKMQTGMGPVCIQGATMMSKPSFELDLSLRLFGWIVNLTVKRSKPETSL
jgi:hypothetical protein